MASTCGGDGKVGSEEVNFAILLKVLEASSWASFKICRELSSSFLREKLENFHQQQQAGRFSHGQKEKASSFHCGLCRISDVLFLLLKVAGICADCLRNR